MDDVRACAFFLREKSRFYTPRTQSPTVDVRFLQACNFLQVYRVKASA
jgi:hypothetical protein